MKKKLLTALAQILKSELDTLSASAAGAREIATHSENRPENKYDTRGLEASYLAGAQSRRMLELRAMINMIERVTIQPFHDDSSIALTALVELDCDGTRTHWFVVPAGAGHTLVVDSVRVQTITPQSPLGRALHEKVTGDIAIVGAGDGERQYEIIRVY